MGAESWSDYQEAVEVLAALPGREREARRAAQAEFVAATDAAAQRAGDINRDIDGLTPLLRQGRSRLDALAAEMPAAVRAAPYEERLPRPEMTPVTVRDELMRLASWTEMASAMATSLRRTLDRAAVQPPPPPVLAPVVTPRPPDRRRPARVAVVVAVVALAILAVVVWILLT
jgi:hypothetical protein